MSDLPLEGKNILVPRGKEQATSFSETIRKLGGHPVEIPLIGFRSVHANEQFKQKITQISQYDWLIITSVNTAKFFLPNISTDVPKLPKIAAIGEKTAQEIEKRGFQIDFIPNEYVAEGFVKDFLPIASPGAKLLLPKGDLARDVIASNLGAHGMHVDELIVYETYLPEESKSILKETLQEIPLHVLTFTSSSTVDHFMSVVQKEQLQAKIENSLIACIGPIAKKTAEDFGLTVHVSPTVYTVPAMIDALVHYLQTNEMNGGSKNHE